MFHVLDANKFYIATDRLQREDITRSGTQDLILVMSTFVSPADYRNRTDSADDLNQWSHHITFGPQASRSVNTAFVLPGPGLDSIAIGFIRKIMQCFAINFFRCTNYLVSI